MLAYVVMCSAATGLRAHPPEFGESFYYSSKSSRELRGVTDVTAGGASSCEETWQGCGFALRKVSWWGEGCYGGEGKGLGLLFYSYATWLGGFTLRSWLAGICIGVT